jgi:hypothetical protein
MDVERYSMQKMRYGNHANKDLADKRRKPRSLLSYLRAFAIVAACLKVLQWFDVHTVMLRSNRIYRNVLYASFACYGVFIAIGLYLTWVVARRDPEWDTDDHNSRLIEVASVFMVLGGIVWIAAMWPVFHIWTLPLGLVCLMLCVTGITLMPAFGPKKKRA